MKVLFAAPENSWGGFLDLIRKELPECHFDASGRFGFDSLKGYDILIPTMSTITRKMLEDGDQLKLVQQCGSGLDIFWEEPPDPDDPIFSYNVLATPHIAGSTDNSMLGIVKMVAKNIRRIVDGKEALNRQNS